MASIESIQFAERFNGITGSAIREILKYMTRPNMISFGGGNPAASALEEDVIADIARDVLLADGKRILQYGATDGYAPYKEAVAGWVKELGIDCSAQDVLPVTGSTQGIDLLAKALINPGDVVLVESPTFLGTLQAFKLYQAKLVPVETDEGGIVLSDLERLVCEYHPKMLYVIPTFQNPTGRTLAADRRKPIAEMAEKYGFVVMEDDPYRDLRYAGEALPSIKSYDKAGWVVHMASFSKLISPGLRIGAAIVQEPIRQKMIFGKQANDVHSSNLTQAIVAAYLERGLMGPHVEAICKSYALQMNRMLEHLASFPDTRYTRPQGGLFIWAELPEGIDTLAMMPKAIDRGVAYVPGTHFYCEEGTHRNTLRLNFSNSTLEKIDEGMEILRSVVCEELKQR